MYPGPNNPFYPALSATDTGATDPIPWPRSAGNFTAQGTFGGTTVKMQYSLDGEVWVDVTNDSGDVREVTSNEGFNFDLPDCQVRGFLTAGTGIDLEIYILPLSRR